MAVACKAQAETPVGKTLWRILGVAAITVGSVVVLLALLTEGQARSALLGGSAGLLANVYAVWRVYASPADTSAERELAQPVPSGIWQIGDYRRSMRAGIRIDKGSGDRRFLDRADHSLARGNPRGDHCTYKVATLRHGKRRANHYRIH